MLPHHGLAPQALSDDGAYWMELSCVTAAGITAIIPIDCHGGCSAGGRLMAQKSLLDIEVALKLEVDFCERIDKLQVEST
jgi:hypothetical protein